MTTLLEVCCNFIAQGSTHLGGSLFPALGKEWLSLGRGKKALSFSFLLLTWLFPISLGPHVYVEVSFHH